MMFFSLHKSTTAAKTAPIIAPPAATSFPAAAFGLTLATADVAAEAAEAPPDTAEAVAAASTSLTMMP